MFILYIELILQFQHGQLNKMVYRKSTSESGTYRVNRKLIHLDYFALEHGRA